MAHIQQHIEESELDLVRKFVKDPVRTLDRLAEVVRTVGRLITNHEVLTETWVDENKNVWTRPTPWAYAQACKARDRATERAKLAEGKLMAVAFTQEQMDAAFKVVQNEEHWKMPIDKVIEDPGQQNLECLRAAIIHFTGSVPTISKREDGKVHVTAAGYYAVIGA